MDCVSTKNFVCFSLFIFALSPSSFACSYLFCIVVALHLLKFLAFPISELGRLALRRLFALNLDFGRSFLIVSSFVVFQELIQLSLQTQLHDDIVFQLPLNTVSNLLLYVSKDLDLFNHRHRKCALGLHEPSLP